MSDHMEMLERATGDAAQPADKKTGVKPAPVAKAALVGDVGFADGHATVTIDHLGTVHGVRVGDKGYFLKDQRMRLTIIRAMSRLCIAQVNQPNKDNIKLRDQLVVMTSEKAFE
jgi:hypothetical protein